MKVPKGYTEDEVIKIIDKVLKKYCYRFAFGVYDKDDLYQEGFIFALEGLSDYDNLGPLENFLTVLIKNRFLDLKRDNYQKPYFHCNNCDEFNEDCESCQKRKRTETFRRNVNQPVNLDSINAEAHKRCVTNYTPFCEVSDQELFKLINQKLPVKYRTDYLKMLDGIWVNKNTREEIMREIEKIYENDRLS